MRLVTLKVSPHEMASAGYARLTICGYLDSAIHFGKWAEAGGLNFARDDG